VAGALDSRLLAGARLSGSDATRLVLRICRSPFFIHSTSRSTSARIPQFLFLVTPDLPPCVPCIPFLALLLPLRAVSAAAFRSDSKKKKNLRFSPGLRHGFQNNRLRSACSKFTIARSGCNRPRSSFDQRFPASGKLKADETPIARDRKLPPSVSFHSRPCSMNWSAASRRLLIPEAC